MQGGEATGWPKADKTTLGIFCVVTLARLDDRSKYRSACHANDFLVPLAIISRDGQLKHPPTSSGTTSSQALDAVLPWHHEFSTVWSSSS